MTGAAAMLEPETGRVVGFAHPRGGRPARAMLRLDGVVCGARLALAPLASLGPAAQAAFGEAAAGRSCAFALRLPREAAGRLLSAVVAWPKAFQPKGPAEWTGDAAPLLEHHFVDPRECARYREGAVMADSATIEDLRLDAGVFRAVLTAPGAETPPEIALERRGRRVGRAAFTALGPGVWALEAPAPPAEEGAAVIAFTAADGATLALYPMAAGAVLAADMVAEVASLRAELDQLKRAFRATLAGGVIARDERALIIAEALEEVDALLDLRDRVDRAATGGDAAPPPEDEEGLWRLDEE